MEHGRIATQLHQSLLLRQSTKKLPRAFTTAKMDQPTSPNISQKQATRTHPTFRKGTCTNQKGDGSNHQANLPNEEDWNSAESASSIEVQLILLAGT
jgi:hypothetical protein